MTSSTLGPYLLACVLLTLAPGPDNLLVISLGLARGRRPAVLAAWGMVSGVLVHTSAAAFGLSAILATSPLAFRIIQTLGAAYLIFLAVQILREGANKTRTSAQRAPLGSWNLFRRGFLMNVLNPKVALFFLAFLPQFVDTGASTPIWQQMILLGFVFMAQAFVIFTLFGLFAGTLGSVLQRRPWLEKWLNRLAAAVFVAVALTLVLGG